MSQHPDLGVPAHPEPPPGSAAAQPVLRVLHGQPTDTELAAVVCVLAAVAQHRPLPVRPLAASRSLWRDRSRNIRPVIGPGPGAWRASGLPR